MHSSINKVKIAGLLLAAGGSSRFGSPKQLMPVHGITLINHILGVMHSSLIDKIYVVLGAKNVQIQKVFSIENIVVLINNQWRKGKSTSIIKGISALSRENYDGVVICVVDQININKDMINSLILEFCTKKSQVVATRILGQQCNPVLFSSSLFPKFMQLRGEEGGKNILPFAENEISYIDWSNPQLMKDIDTKEDLQSLSSSRKPLR